MSGQPLFRDTIYALSTGGLPSGVAVIRMSGPHARDTLAAVAGGLPSPRVATLCRFADRKGTTIDRGLALFFPAPASFTGEDCGELHLHGGRAVVAAMLSDLARRPGLRQAEAGEFTRRAFVNGKLDLTGAEGLADLLAAETETQRRLALANAEGGQKALYSGWRESLVRVRAMVEADLDFSDEADVGGVASAGIGNDLAALSREIGRHVAGHAAAEIVRDGFRVALVGVPNAGKSSLLNALARREVAIVTEVPGTTRDAIEVALELRGMKVLVTDTAGIRETEDRVERIGVSRALEVAARADLVLELVDVTTQVRGAVPLSGAARRLAIGTKRDLEDSEPEGFDFLVSTRTGDGIERLLARMEEEAAAATAACAGIVPTRLRHVELLEETKARIDTALAAAALELKAEELRLASDALGRITGAIDVEDLLDMIFSQFCIGK